MAGSSLLVPQIEDARHGEGAHSWGMYAVHLTDAELETARHALQAYLLAFGHGEAETVGEI